MVVLAKHLWDQFVHDEDRAKIWLSSLKTALLAVAVQVGVLTGGNAVLALGWSAKQWIAVVLATVIAAGAKAADPVTKK